MADDTSEPSAPLPPYSDPQRRADFTEHRGRTGDDPNRRSIQNLRVETLELRKELRADIEKVADDSRGRDRELHHKIDEFNRDLDRRVDGHDTDLATLKTRLADMERREKDEFADVPWYARPSYIKAIGLAVAAVLAALIASLGLIFGWGGTSVPSPAAPAASSAAEDPEMGG